jgi:hypothetical protein
MKSFKTSLLPGRGLASTVPPGDESGLTNRVSGEHFYKEVSMPPRSFSIRVILDSAVIAAFLLACAIYGCSGWTKAEIAKEAAWEALHLIDYRQTVQTARNPDQYFEYNPLLGEHPSEGRVNVYFIGWAILHPIITDILPREKTLLGVQAMPRAFWQNISLVVSGACVINNFSIGLNGEW